MAVKTEYVYLEATKFYTHISADWISCVKLSTAGVDSSLLVIAQCTSTVRVTAYLLK